MPNATCRKDIGCLSIVESIANADVDSTANNSFEKNDIVTTNTTTTKRTKISKPEGTTKSKNVPQKTNVTTILSIPKLTRKQVKTMNNTNSHLVQNHKITRIVFVKSHKTGSTTLASIFQRFGLVQKLLFALPKSKHIFSTTKLFSRKFVLPKPTSLAKRSFDILTNHAVYNRKEMDAVVPDAKYIAIVRDPVFQFESAFGYFEWANGMGLSNHLNPLETFMKDPLYYYTHKKYAGKRPRAKTASSTILGFSQNHI